MRNFPRLLCILLLATQVLPFGALYRYGVADLLRGVTDEIRGLPLPEKKARIRSLITRIDYYLTGPSEGPEGAASADSEGLFRTSPLWVITRIQAKAPESGDSGALRAIPYNRMRNGSGMDVIGSAGRIRTCDLKVMSLASYLTAPPRVNG